MSNTFDLRGLFRDPDMFKSRDRWQKAGFAVMGEGLESDIMVGSHPSLPGHLFKKYRDKISNKDQLENYRRRVDGADKLRELVAAQHLTHIKVPQKFLYELPDAFTQKKRPAYVLVVEQLQLLPSDDSKTLFRSMSNEVLQQLCTVLRKFRGLDSGVRNVPFTSTGQIAFVDTERWDGKKKVWLKRIREYLSSEQRAFADALQ
jgi:hypothetical protein